MSTGREARAVYCEYGFSYDPESADAVQQVRKLFLEASELAVTMAASLPHLTAPGPIWVYRRALGYTR